MNEGIDKVRHSPKQKESTTMPKRKETNVSVVSFGFVSLPIILIRCLNNFDTLCEQGKSGRESPNLEDEGW